MSLLSAIVEHFDNSQAAEAVTARSAIREMWADVLQGEPDKPFCVVSEATTRRTDESKASGRRPMIRETIVTFQVWAPTRAEGEAALEALDQLYLGDNGALTIANATHMATFFEDSQSMFADGCWQTMLALRFKFSKS